MNYKNPITITDATQQDADELVAHIRKDDLIEVTSITGQSVQDVITTGMLTSTKVWAARSDAGLVALFGYANVSDSTGIPWLLGTDLMKHHAKDLLRASPPYLKLMKAVFPRLTNIVDVRNKAAIRWLSWLGFSFSEPVLAGINNNIPVRVFTMSD
jgi:hypothetical protein